MSKQCEGNAPREFMKRFDHLISNVNAQLKLLETKTRIVPKKQLRQMSTSTTEGTSTSRSGDEDILEIF